MLPTIQADGVGVGVDVGDIVEVGPPGVGVLVGVGVAVETVIPPADVVSEQTLATPLTVT